MIKLHITVTMSKTIPEIKIYTASVENEVAAWPEVFGSLEQLRAFVLGVRAGASVLNDFNVEIVKDSGVEI